MLRGAFKSPDDCRAGFRDVLHLAPRSGGFPGKRFIDWLDRFCRVTFDAFPLDLPIGVGSGSWFAFG